MKSWLVTLLLLVALPVEAQEAFPPGEEFQVNSYTSGDQLLPDIAADAQGNFVVVWESYGSNGTDSSDYSVQGQRFDARGEPLGGQFQANFYTTSYQTNPAVASDAEGNFVVVWDSGESTGSDASLYSIHARRFDNEGSPQGREIQVNSYTSSDQWRPSVAADAAGNFVVVWGSYGSFDNDSSEDSIQGQRFSSDGTALGGQFQINSYTTSNQWRPDVSANGTGTFVVVWSSWGSASTDKNGSSIQGHRFKGDGKPLGGQFQINSYTTYNQWGPAVAMDSDGNFMVVWESEGSFGSDTSGWSIQGQRYDSSGNAQGAQFQVNSYTTGTQARPSLASDALGNFVVAWTSQGGYGTDTSSDSVQAQRYDQDGFAIGSQFQVNTYTTNRQTDSCVTVDALGGITLGWNSLGSLGSDSSDGSVQGRHFGPILIFFDGFESGDTSAWSSTVE